MELKDLVALYRRWFWLLLVGVLTGAGTGYMVSRLQTPVYEATAKVLITKSRPQSGTDILSISDQQLVLTYQELLKTRPVLDEAAARLGGVIDPDNIRVQIIASTQIIQIDVRDADPQRAAEISNTLVQILIEQNETLQAGRYTVYEESLNAQISQVQGQIGQLQGQITQINQATIAEQLTLVNQQITDLQEQISNLEREITQFPSILNTLDRARLSEKQTQLDQLRSLLAMYQEIQTNLTFIGKPLQSGTTRDDPRITGLQSTLNLYQGLYLSLLNNLASVELARVQSTPTVSLIERAAPPEEPIRPLPMLYTLLSGMVGGLLAAGSILLIDYFDDTIRSSQKIQEVLGLPVLGQITEIPHTNKKSNGSHIPDRENSVLLNTFGTLRINVSRLMKQEPSKTILVTSPGLGEGKTTISIHLAAAFASSGKRVVLVDTDFYHPQIHTRLGLESQAGLSDILANNINWQEVTQDIDGVTVLTSGSPMPGPTALFESEIMTQLLEKLNKKADIIILDGPPLFIVDSQILASKVGGVLLVIRQGDTLTAIARAMIDQLKLLEVNVLGVVVNRIPRAASYYFDGYYRGILPKENPLELSEEIKAKQN